MTEKREKDLEKKPAAPKAPSAKKSATPKAVKEVSGTESDEAAKKKKRSSKTAAADEAKAGEAAAPRAKRTKKAVAEAAVSDQSAVSETSVPDIPKKTTSKKKSKESQTVAASPAAQLSAPAASAPRAPAAAVVSKPAPVKPAPVETPRPAVPAAPPSSVKPQPPAVTPVPEKPAAPRSKVKINEFITVKDLAERMNIKFPDLIKKLMSLGTMASINQRIDADTATVVADTFNFDVEIVPLYSDAATQETPEDAAQLQPRPPVVTVMGHVDHGKTSLLDSIRQTKVAEKEAGGITQHIGAYQVPTDKGPITFLDTPGHEAFTAMRARGAQVTDIVVLVVAADDGVMPQTLEALDHAQAAGVPIVVAINKCDLPTANPQKIKQELANHNLLSEDWGGKTVMVEVSARQKINLDKLLEMLLLEAELLELKANPNRPAQAVVVEARLDPRRGAVATVLVQKGTLRVGDAFVCGLTTGKIRALVDHKGDRVKEAPPAYPVEILGLSETPQAGDRLTVMATEREAREIVERRRSIADDEIKVKRHHVTLEDLHAQVSAGKMKSLPIILKADVQGSVEAVRDSLEKLSNAEITLKVIHSGVGGITSSDVILAAASDAVILGFNVRPDPSSEEMARREAVEIKTYRIIYDMVNDVKAALEGLLDPEEKESTVGWAEVRQVFRVPKAGTVAGCYVTEGKVTRTSKARLIRNGAIVFEGSIGGLRRFKDDVREVEKGFECGISLDNYNDLKPGDRLEMFVIEKQARRLA